ncbi:hypothetical protein OAF54_02025 [bacterium]|nr:hypothetical protein [bacterium]
MNKQQAQEMGSQAFQKGIGYAPILNAEFQKNLPQIAKSPEFWKIREGLYKAYMKGWTIENMRNV